MTKRTPPFFCLLSRAPDTSSIHTDSQNFRNVAIPIIKNRQA